MLLRQVIRFQPALLIVIASSCDSLGPDDVLRDQSASIQTAELHYTMEDDGVSHRLLVPTTYINRTGRTVYERWCSRVLEKKVGNSWQVAFSPVCPSIAVEPTAYEPDTPHPIDFSVLAAYAPNSGPRFELSPIPGIYRFRVDLYATRLPSPSGPAGVADILPLADRITNAFWLDIP